MSFTKKVVTTYSKALFQNLLTQSPDLLTYSNLDDSYFGVFTETAEGEKTILSQANWSLSKLIQKSPVEFLESTIYTCGEELMLLRMAFLSSEKVKNFCTNPTINEKIKEKLLLTLFPGLSLTMRSFIKILGERSHTGLLPEVSEAFQKILLKYKKIVQARIITASSLEVSSGNLLLKTLKKITNANEVLLTVSYDPKLLGGFILEYNSVALDASLLNEFSLFFNEI